MSIRSTNQIMIAVSECEPCTDDELRMCISAIGAMLRFAKRAADDMSEGIESGGAGVKHKVCARHWKNNADGRFKSIKMPVDEYLGPHHTPGSPEQVECLRLGKAIVKQGTGIDLEASA